MYYIIIQLDADQIKINVRRYNNIFYMRGKKMGRNPFGKHVLGRARSYVILWGLEYQKSLGIKSKEIALLEGTTVSFLLRRQLITLIRKKCREYNIENLKLPKFVYPGPRYQRPKRKKLKSKFIAENISQERKEDLEAILTKNIKSVYRLNSGDSA